MIFSFGDCKNCTDRAEYDRGWMYTIFPFKKGAVYIVYNSGICFFGDTAHAYDDDLGFFLGSLGGDCGAIHFLLFGCAIWGFNRLNQHAVLYSDLGW